MNTAFRVLLTFNATSLLVIIFAVQKGYSLGYFFGGFACFDWIAALPNAVSYLLYFLIPVLSTGLSIWLSKYLGKDDFKAGEVASIEHANNSFLPSYLGYFFVALSIGRHCGLFMAFCLFLLSYRKHSTLTHCFYCLVMSFITLQPKTERPFSLLAESATRSQMTSKYHWLIESIITHLSSEDNDGPCTGTYKN